MTAKVSVKDVTVALLPRRQSVKPGGTITFSAKALNDYAPNHDSLYRFSATGGLGTIVEKDLLGTPVATYRAGSAQGKDTVKVEVFRLVQGNPLKIAETTGEARIEEEPTIIRGTYDIFVSGNESSAIVRFSPVEGATQYRLHGYGGYDDAYYGSNIEQTLNPPFTIDAYGVPVSNAFGLSGYSGVGSQATAKAWFDSRFGAFTWEIEAVK